MTDTDLRTRLADLLTALGDTRQKVADTLHANLHLGVPGECGACPVAAYLHANLTVAEVAVSDLEVAVWPQRDDPTSVSVDTPKPVAEFILGFDYGMFPLLVKGGEQA